MPECNSDAGSQSTSSVSYVVVGNVSVISYVVAVVIARADSRDRNRSFQASGFYSLHRRVKQLSGKRPSLRSSLSLRHRPLHTTSFSFSGVLFVLHRMGCRAPHFALELFLTASIRLVAVVVAIHADGDL